MPELPNTSQPPDFQARVLAKEATSCTVAACSSRNDPEGLGLCLLLVQDISIPPLTTETSDFYLSLSADSPENHQTALLVAASSTGFTTSEKHIIANSFPPLPHLWQEAGAAAKG